MGSDAEKTRQIRCIIKSNAMVDYQELKLHGTTLVKWYKIYTSKVSHPRGGARPRVLIMRSIMGGNYNKSFA